MPQPHSPTVRGRRVASDLRDLREAAGLTTEQVAAHLGQGWNRHKVGRIESAKIKPTIKDITTLLDLYGVDAATRAALFELNRNAWQRGWWEDYRDLFPKGSYVAQENDADRIDEWSPQLVPGLLQTDAYAHEIIRVWSREDGEEETQRRLRARLQRRALLSRTDPPAPHVTAVIDEAVLHRPIGGEAVMRDQVQALLAAARRPNVTILVLPFSVGSHAGLDGPFIVLGFPDEIAPDVAYVETKAGGNHIESRDGVHRFKLDFVDLKDAALDAQGSMEFIAALAKE
jgi:transcriptional regulator with XRE-family HTH domain